MDNEENGRHYKIHPENEGIDLYKDDDGTRMQAIPATILENIWNSIIHSKTQVHPVTLDLTVGEIHEVRGGGRLDFGGSEFNEAPTIPIKPIKKTRDDKYGWWDLKQGRYMVVYNEQLLDSWPGAIILTFIFPHRRFLLAGGIMPSSIIDPKPENTEKEKIKGIISVGEVGLHIKENARIATACCLRQVA